jgi:hypothetical protein
MGFLAKARKKCKGQMIRSGRNLSMSQAKKRAKDPQEEEKQMFMGAPNKKKAAVRKYVDGVKNSRRKDIVALQDEINGEAAKRKSAKKKRKVRGAGTFAAALAPTLT